MGPFRCFFVEDASEFIVDDASVPGVDVVDDGVAADDDGCGGAEGGEHGFDGVGDRHFLFYFCEIQFYYTLMLVSELFFGLMTESRKFFIKSPSFRIFIPLSNSCVEENVLGR